MSDLFSPEDLESSAEFDAILFSFLVSLWDFDLSEDFDAFEDFDADCDFSADAEGGNFSDVVTFFEDVATFFVGNFSDCDFAAEFFFADTAEVDFDAFDDFAAKFFVSDAAEILESVDFVSDFFEVCIFESAPDFKEGEDFAKEDSVFASATAVLEGAIFFAEDFSAIFSDATAIFGAIFVAAVFALATFAFEMFFPPIK